MVPMTVEDKEQLRELINTCSLAELLNILAEAAKNDAEKLDAEVSRIAYVYDDPIGAGNQQEYALLVLACTKALKVWADRLARERCESKALK